MLQMGGFPTGEAELASDSTTLNGIKFLMNKP
jgi:hypothetical protein